MFIVLVCAFTWFPVTGNKNVSQGERLWTVLPNLGRWKSLLEVKISAVSKLGALSALLQQLHYTAGWFCWDGQWQWVREQTLGFGQDWFSAALPQSSQWDGEPSAAGQDSKVGIEAFERDPAGFFPFGRTRLNCFCFSVQGQLSFASSSRHHF